MRCRHVQGMVLAVVLLLPALWSGLVFAAGPKGKVVIWYDSGAAWSPFITDFNKQLAAQYPDITVEWVTQDAAQLSAKLVAAFAAKQGPDIALGSQYRLVAVEQQFKAWADLSARRLADAELKETVGALPKAHVDSYYSGRKLWGLPQVVQSVGLFVRKSWAEKVKAKVPEDWDELTALAERFTREIRTATGRRTPSATASSARPGVTNSCRHPVPVLGSGGRDAAPDRGRRGEAVVQHRRRARGRASPAPLAARGQVTSPATPTFTHKEFYEVVQAGKCGIGRVGAWNVGPWAKTAMGEDFVVIPYPPAKKGQRALPGLLVERDRHERGLEGRGRDLRGLQGAARRRAGRRLFYEKLTSAARTDLDWGRLATQPAARLLHAAPDLRAGAHLPRHLAPVLDILSRHLNGMLADAKVDPVKALADADREAQAKVAEIRKK